MVFPFPEMVLKVNGRIAEKKQFWMLNSTFMLREDCGNASQSHDAIFVKTGARNKEYFNFAL
jgi:hypothetical protein